MSFINDLENEVRAGFQPSEEQVKEGIRNKMDEKIGSMERTVEDRQAELAGFRAELEQARVERDTFFSEDQPQG